MHAFRITVSFNIRNRNYIVISDNYTNAEKLIIDDLSKTYRNYEYVIKNIEMIGEKVIFQNKE